MYSLDTNYVLPHFLFLGGGGGGWGWGGGLFTNESFISAGSDNMFTWLFVSV